MAKRKSPLPSRARGQRPLEIACWGDRSFAFLPERTALLAIDMQRDFFGDEDGEEQDPMRAVIPRVAELIAFARQTGCLVVHTRECYAPDLSDVTDYRRSLGYVGRKGPLGRFLIRGEKGCEFVDEVKPLAGETVIDKPGFSAFYRSDLDEVLRKAGVDHLIFCGVTTQCCVHSTLREAVDLGYWCLTVADCCAAEDDALHDAALMMIGGEGDLFGWVADLRGVLSATAPQPRARNVASLTKGKK